MHRKFTADKIFDGYQFLQRKVLITNERGVIIDIVDERESGDGVEVLKGILCPGFINAHCHLELSHMKGHIPKHTGLVDFILKVVNERHYAENEIFDAIEKAEDEMLQNGIVAVGDICNNVLTIPQKKKARLWYHNFIEASGFVPALANDRFVRSMEILNEYKSGVPFQESGISPHAPYSVSPGMFEMINNLPANHLLTIHNQEATAENDFFSTGTGDFLRLYQQLGIDISFFKASGNTSLQTWLPYFSKEQMIILVHNVCTSVQDLDFVKFNIENSPQGPAGKLKIFFCLCPNANLYISNNLPDIKMLMHHTENIVLGTDSLASNEQLSILAEIKTLQSNFNDVDLAVLLKWATSNGAKALQMYERLGSFEKNKQPGVILIEDAVNLNVSGSRIKRIL